MNRRLRGGRPSQFRILACFIIIGAIMHKRAMNPPYQERSGDKRPWSVTVLPLRPKTTILSVIVVARAAPAANDASDTTPAPASAITVDIPAVDDSLPGFKNENSSSSERLVGRDMPHSGDDVVDRIRLRDEYLLRLNSITTSKPAEYNSYPVTRSSRTSADVNIDVPYGPFSLLYYSPFVAVGMVPYSLSSLGYASASGAYNAFPNKSTFRQAPSFPFQVQWPLAPYFPVLIKDPFLTFFQGGSWNDLVEYGQAADVCTHRRFKNLLQPRPGFFDEYEEPTHKNQKPLLTSRRGRSLAKRAVSQATPSLNSFAVVVQKEKKIKKNKYQKTKPVPLEENKPNEKIGATVSEENGDLRFPFGGFDWFGNKKPVAPSPGFFINRLKVHRGGVAIAGPGGVATAGRGGTAVVGPGGLAYTQPGGLAVAGPHTRAYLRCLPTRTWTRWRNEFENVSASGSPPLPDPQAALVATGPVVYYHNESRSSA
ncbi:hypothetical protein EVAR_43590_1 [Eumeta japonica]|uniref:DUF4774 domain-containing protein n=1 Tax=Eumeta variegata TaxID=151549 RepID=A0A4C1XEP7_EUMVA|nr:hypothetical protein EVAR_43590_1 [Eumeta japonica]